MRSAILTIITICAIIGVIFFLGWVACVSAVNEIGNIDWRWSPIQGCEVKMYTGEWIHPSSIGLYMLVNGPP